VPFIASNGLTEAGTGKTVAAGGRMCTTWWPEAVPKVVRDNVQKNYEREASEGLPPRSDRFIDYTTFGELGEIVKENWKVFSGLFSNATRNRVPRVINRLNVVRGMRQ
jgi:hypothetical protein